MKKSVLLLVLALIMNVAFVSAKETKVEKNIDKTNQEFASFLRPISLTGMIDNDITVRVRVFVTADREIVVLSTNAQNVELANSIKETLNNKKLSSDVITGQNYIFNIVFKA